MFKALDKTDHQQKTECKFYTKASEPCFQNAIRSRNDTTMEKGAWTQPSTVAMVWNDLAHTYLAIWSRNIEIRACTSVPMAGLSLFLMPAVDLLDWICRRAPKQVKGPENFWVFSPNKFIMLSVSKFNQHFLNIQTTLLLVKAASAFHSCNALIRPWCLPKKYFNLIYKGLNCSLCLFTRNSEYLVMMIPSNLIPAMQCNVYAEMKNTEGLHIYTVTCTQTLFYHSHSYMTTYISKFRPWS